MAAGHPKSKLKDTETKTATQRSQPCTSSLAGNQHLSEASLRKLSRAELQKLARVSIMLSGSAVVLIITRRVWVLRNMVSRPISRASTSSRTYSRSRQRRKTQGMPHFPLSKQKVTGCTLDLPTKILRKDPRGKNLELQRPRFH